MKRDFETVKLELDGGLATITLNRAEHLNAFTPQTARDLIACFDLTDADDEVRAVIVTGAGKAFCAGADLSSGWDSFSTSDDDAQAHQSSGQAERERDAGGRVVLRIFSSLKPVIAAVNGAAVGVGATMQLPMDIRLASTHAKFGFVFARRGIVPESASAWFLPRIVGVSTALEWCYSGRIVPAAEAMERGLLRSIHQPEDLLPAARALAQEIAANTSPVSIAMTRQMLWRMLCADHPMEAHRVDSKALAGIRESADAREGVQSFLERRPANFTSRVSRDMPAFFPWWTEPRF
jgi:enoyl-CoA hydratase/carnithine racemase